MKKRQIITDLSAKDLETVHRDRRRLLGQMAKLLDAGFDGEDDLRAALTALEQREGSQDHEKIVRYWRSLVGETEARRKRQK